MAAAVSWLQEVPGLPADNPAKRYPVLLVLLLRDQAGEFWQGQRMCLN
jgi:hypothetical protein